RRASMRPRLISRGKREKMAGFVRRQLASMRPRLISRGKLAMHERLVDRQAASMRPRLISRGTPCVALVVAHEPLVASMRPRLISRGKRSSGFAPAPASRCFNEAAADQPRKTPIGAHTAIWYTGFNEAAADQPRKTARSSL